MMKINRFNTEFRAMRGLIMLAILFELFITGIEAPGGRRREKRKLKTWHSEQSVMEEERLPMVNLVEEQSLYEEDSFPMVYPTEEQSVYEEDNLPKIDFIEGLTMFQNLFTLRDPIIDQEQVTLFFRKEKRILQEVETFIKSPSLYTSSSEELGMPENEEQTFALVYITFLSFWISVNFKICSLILSYSKNKDEMALRSVCDLHFNTMAFAFEEFKEILRSTEIEFKDYRLQSAKENMLQFYLEFEVNGNDELEQKTNSAINNCFDFGRIGCLRRSNIHVDEKNENYITLLNNLDKVFKKYRDNIPWIFDYLIRQMDNKMRNIFSELCDIFKDQITTGNFHELEKRALWSPSWYTFKYEDSKQMWQYVTQAKFLGSTDTEKLDRIQKAITLILVIRNIDYSLLYNFLQAYN